MLAASRSGRGGSERGRGEERTRGLLGPARTVERWKERRREVPVGTGGTGLGMSAGRRFMWLLIESFSLDRAACFLPSRDSLRALSPPLSPFRLRQPLPDSLFLSFSTGPRHRSRHRTGPFTYARVRQPLSATRRGPESRAIPRPIRNACSLLVLLRYFRG